MTSITESIALELARTRIGRIDQIGRIEMSGECRIIPALRANAART